MNNAVAAIFLLLLALRLGGAIDIPYVYVFLPLWLPLLTLLVILVLSEMLAGGNR